MLFGVFGFIGAINWAYESKLLTPRQGVTEWSEVYLGPIMLACAVGETLFGCLVLLVVRLIWPKVTRGPWMLLPVMLVAILFIFPSLFIVVLGPAAITMVEQMRAAPR
jgi:hypothetical protein